jgi:hypothetical protein
MSKTDLISDAQLSSLQDACDESETIIVVTQLPLYFHTAVSAAIADWADGEMYPGHVAFARPLRRIWSIVSAVPNVIFVSGDIHMSSISRVCVGRTCHRQAIHSGMTKASTSMYERKIMWFHYLVTEWFQRFSCLLMDLAMFFDTKVDFRVCTTMVENAHYGANYGYDTR